MNYGDLQTYFLQTLNNRTITPTLAMTWLQQAIVRAERLLQTPAQERVVLIPITVPTDAIPIPDDYEQLISLSFDGVDLERREASVVVPLSQIPGNFPRYYCRVTNSFFIAPQPPVGSSIALYYRADFPDLVNPTDSNWLSETAPQTIVDGAMVFASRYLMDPRGPVYEQSFTQSIADINATAAADELLNAAVSVGPRFSSCCDW